MTHISVRTWLYGIMLGLVLVLTLSLSASTAGCDSSQPGDACSAHFELNRGQVSVMDGYASSANWAVYQAQLPVAGALTYADLKLVETQARVLLKANKDFREDISPSLGKPNFDQVVRQFDINGGFTAIYTDTLLGQITLQDRIDRADQELRRARDLYAFLAVYADDTRFRADSDYITSTLPGYSRVLCPVPPPGDDPLTGDVDWCDFSSRMRQSVREAAYLRMIFGQQFTVDAMGLHFDTGEPMPEGIIIVRDEVRKLQQAVAQYELAETVVTEGLDRALGSGCYVADFYSPAEWALLSRAVDGKERAQHHIAVRMSYLDDYGSTAAQSTYQASSIEQYVTLIGTAGQAASQPRGQGCARGTRPDSDMVAKMAADMLDTREKSRQMQEGRNIFGFDVHFTPARPYLTAGNSNDTGIWDEAMSAARQAKEWQNDEVAASRQFDQNADQLQNAILGVKGNYDKRLLDLTGCSRNNFGSDQDYFACVDGAATKLQQCDVQGSQAAYDACVVQVPTGLLRQAWDGLRAAYLRAKRVKQSMDDIPSKVASEDLRNVTINHAILTNAQDQVITQVLESVLGATTISFNFGTNPSMGISFNPGAREVGLLRSQSGLREAAKQMQINDANKEAAVRNLMLELGELRIDLEVAVQEFNAQAAQFQTLAAEAKDTGIEARRARAYLQQSPANDPSFRLVRDSARLRLASQLEYAARVSYMAAKRVEYEYAARLSASNFRISDIYRARTADDIIRFLSNLKAITNAMIVYDSDIQQEDFKVSVALHLLGLTDQNLGLTGDAARAERLRRFRLWVAEHTYPGTDGKPVLAFNFTTSVVTNSVFSNVILQGYDRFWLHEMSGIGQPKADNTGFAINLVTAQSGNLRYRRVIVTESGLVHLRARSGCIFEYRLIHPAALLGLEWPPNQNPEWATTDFKASVNNAGGERTPAFLARPVSATDWQVEVRAGTPDPGLDEMDLQKLTDVELNFSTTRASRTSGEPRPEDCVRIDW